MIRRVVQVGTLLILLAIGWGLAAASESLPNPIERPAPAYPDSARRAGLEGTVLVRALISEIGTVDTVVVESGPSIFRASAMAAVRRWRFQPPTYDGKAIRVWIAIPMRFQLDEQSLAIRQRAAREELRDFLLHAKVVRLYRLAPTSKPGEPSKPRGKPIAEFVALESRRLRDQATRETWVELLCDSTNVFLNASAGYGIARPAWALTFEIGERRVLALIADPENAAQIRDAIWTWNGSVNTQGIEFLHVIAASFPRHARASPGISGWPAGP